MEAEGSTVAERLRRERQRLNLTQEALAEALSTSPRSVRRWESGDALPQPHYRARYCSLFGLSSDVLFGTGVTSSPAPPLPDTIAEDRRQGARRAVVAVAVVLLLGTIVFQRDSRAVRAGPAVPGTPAGGARASTADLVSSSAVFDSVAGPGCPEGADRGVTETNRRRGWVRIASGGWQGAGCDGSFRDSWNSGSDTSYNNTFTWWFRPGISGAAACTTRVYVPLTTKMVQAGGNRVLYEVLTGSDHHLIGTFTLDQRDHHGEWLEAGTFTATDGYLALRLTDSGQGSHYVAASALSVRCDAA